MRKQPLQFATLHHSKKNKVLTDIYIAKIELTTQNQIKYFLY